MFFLVYLSAAVTWFSGKELREMLATCRTNNTRDGITGMLLYKDGNFMQVLEGEETAVRALLHRITGDLRHRSLVVIDSGTAPMREFGAWSMAFTDLSPRSDTSTAATPDGYSEFMNLPLSAPEFVNNPERCHRLLQMFRQLD